MIIANSNVHKTEEETIALGPRSLEIDRDRLQERPRQIRHVTIVVTWVTLPDIAREGQNVAVILELKEEEPAEEIIPMEDRLRETAEER